MFIDVSSWTVLSPVTRAMTLYDGICVRTAFPATMAQGRLTSTYSSAKCESFHRCDISISNSGEAQT